MAASEKLTAAFLSKKLCRDISEVKLRDQDKMGGMSAEIGFIDVTAADSEQFPMVLKTCPPGNDLKIAQGCAREAFFYNELAPQLGTAVPKCYFAEGNMATGEMLMLIECVEGAVPAGTFFGPGNPNNWGVKDKLPEMCQDNPAADRVTADAFKLYAGLHSTYWQDDALLSKDWLRAAGWHRGEDESSWVNAQKQAADAWSLVTKARTDGTSAITWDSHLVACLDVSYGKIDWSAFQAELKSRPFALVHGDCHPHNALWTMRPKGTLRLIDFEQIGIGSPAQDLGQWMISHMEPSVRRGCERELVGEYHAELMAALAALGKTGGFTLDACWEEYVAGGCGRWVWFIPILVQMCPAPMAQFFHDQLAAFLHEHILDASTSPMPRV